MKVSKKEKSSVNEANGSVLTKRTRRNQSNLEIEKVLDDIAQEAKVDSATKLVEDEKIEDEDVEM